LQGSYWYAGNVAYLNLIFCTCWIYLHSAVVLLELLEDDRMRSEVSVAAEGDKILSGYQLYQ
jgi:hypothetical protein